MNLAGAAAPEVIKLEAQEGKQKLFLSTPADLAIYGGARGGGKSYGLLLEPTRHTHVPGFTAAIFRRTSVEARQDGGLWDQSWKLYPHMGAVPISSRLEWAFGSGARVRFPHLEHEKDKLAWHGAQVCLLGFDELTSFSESQFWYMLAVNRSTCGVRPYVRATCNPDADSWVAKLIAWWIDQESGYPIEARAGLLRWILRAGDTLYQADSLAEAEELKLKHGVDPLVQPLSLTFIPAKLEDNPALMSKDPGYRSRLSTQGLVEQMRFLGGNWKIRPSAGMFKREWFKPLQVAPAEVRNRIRFWDLAATAGAGDYTVGQKWSKTREGLYVIEHQVRDRIDSAEVRALVRGTAAADGRATTVGLFIDPGQAGKDQQREYSRLLDGFRFIFLHPTNKVSAAGLWAAQAGAGNVGLVEGPWNEEFLNEVTGFPLGKNDDCVDAGSGAYRVLAGIRPEGDHGVTP